MHNKAGALQNVSRKRRERLGALLASVSLLLFSGCGSVKGSVSKMDAIDPTLGLKRSDYRHMTDPKRDGSEVPEPLSVTVDKAPPPVPQLAEILAAPRPPKIGETQLVSISVTDDVPLKDVLLELAKLADVDIELDAGIAGGISFIAKEKPFNEVVDRIANLANLRYSMKNGVLRVERDTPFIKSYAVDFLNLDRESESTVNLSTNVLSTSVSGSSGGSSGSASGVTTGSTSKVSAKTKGDFWDSLKTGLDQIISYQPAQRVSSSTLQADADTSMLTGAAQGGGAAAPAAAAQAIATPAEPAGGTGNTKQYTLNRQAGILTFNGTSKQQELVETLLDKLKSNSSAQVLIEAKILEVDLNEQYKTGINWSAVGNQVGGAGTFNTVGNALTTASDVASISVTKGDFSALLSAVETFGTTRTLSSPRLHAINNQPSTLTFATNKVYFQLKIDKTSSTTSSSSTAITDTTVSSTLQTVPVGIMMSIMPSIDLEHNEVTLSVRPTLSSTSGEGVADPAVVFAAKEADITDVQNIIPEIQVRELDSTVRMKSGETMVIGGLMQQTAENSDKGVPFVSRVPLFGNLFKDVSRNSNNKELVLLIKATIIGNNSSLDKADKTLFRKFSDDPRPVTF